MVKGDGENDDCPGYDLLNPVRQTPLRRAQLDDRHDRRAHKRSEHGASAPEQAASADDDRRDHVEFEARRNRGIPDRQF